MEKCSENTGDKVLTVTINGMDNYLNNTERSPSYKTLQDIFEETSTSQYSAQLSELISSYKVLSEKRVQVFDARDYNKKAGEAKDLIFGLLGCIRVNPRNHRWVFEYDSQPPIAFQPAVREFFGQLLAREMSRTLSNHDDYALFTGIGINNRWEVCLQEPHDPYVFVARMLRITKWVQSQDAKMCMSLQGHLLPLLNGICKPEKEWAIIPPMKDICQHLFGQAWWEIYRPDLNTEIDEHDPQPVGDWETWDFYYFDCHQQILDARPPFLPGVLPNYPQLPEVTLPNGL